jgi:hypothetical protein
MAKNPIALSRIEAAAPDQPSLAAARKLLVLSKWPSLERDGEQRFLWGACQGSGASAYRVAVEIEDLGAKCSCPSRKFPCKHALALMWWFAERPDRFQEAAVPDWVTEWHGRRRRSGATADKDAASSGPPKSARAAVAEAAAAESPRDAEASARQKERNRAAREASIAQGLDELDVWIGDQIDRGLGSFGARAAEQCRLLARRLVDAKAGGLANQVDQLPTLYFQTPEARRHDVLLEQIGGLHLLAQAYRRQALLDPGLVHDVRAGVGWTLTRDDVLGGAATLRRRARWIVLATRREAQPDGLVRYETFLAADDAHGATDNADGAHRTAAAAGAHAPRSAREPPQLAMLLDFVPAAVAASAGPGLAAGTALDAELAFYPSATPLRAIVAAQHSSAPAAHAPHPAEDLRAALDRYDARLAVNPWIASWPIAFNDARVELSQDGTCWAVNRDGTCGVPLAGEEAHVLLDLANLELYGKFDGRELTPLAANSALGPFWSSYA